VLKTDLIPQERSDLLEAPALHPPQSGGNNYGLSNFLRVIMRRRAWIAGAVVAGCTLSILITAMTKPTYQASTIIELNKSSSGSLDADLGQVLSQSFGGSGEALQTDLQTETTILEGDSLALAVIQKLNLTSSPELRAGSKAAKLEAEENGLPLDQAPRTRVRLLSGFHHRLSVAPIHGTRLIRVSYESHDPKLAAAIANALIDSYKAQYLKSHYDATSEVSDWLTGQLSDLKANVQESEKKLADFEKQTGILSLSMMMGSTSGQDDSSAAIHSPVITKLDTLNAELTAAEANRIQKEAIYRLAASRNGDALIALAASPGVSQVSSPAAAEIAILQQLRAQQNSLKMSLAHDSVAMDKNNRHIRELDTQIAEGERQIAAEMQQITRLAGADLQLAQQTEQQIQHEFDQQQGKASKLNEQTVEFAVLRQEAFSRKKLYEDLYTRLQEANVAAGIKATNITVVEPARSDSRPIRPARTTNLAAGLSLGLLGGLMLAFAVDRLDNRVVNPLEVEDVTGEPVLGIIPTFGSSPHSLYGSYGARLQKRLPKPDAGKNGTASMWMINHPGSGVAEAFRSLRTAILLARAGGGAKVILFTGCVPGEGKSTVTCNLAISFAQNGKKVIIVEADMRRPGMKHVMDVPNVAGLSNVLTGTRKLDEVLLRGVQVPTLDVLPAGPRPPMPSEILGSSAFDHLLIELTSRYDLVMIDSPPALVVTDAVCIAPKCDAIVWVVRAGAVARPQLARAAQIIERNRLPVIGFVLNRMDRALDPYSYDYGYAYGHEYKNYGSYYGDDSHEA